MKKSSIIIEITDTHVMAALSSGQKANETVSFAFVRPLGDRSDSAVVEALKELKAILPGESQSTSLVIPREKVLIKCLVLPAQASVEIREMLKLQIAGQIPYSRDEIIYDYILSETKESGYSSVLAVVLQKEQARHYLQLMEAGGFHPSRFLESSQGIAAFFNSRTAKQDETVGVIHCSKSHLELCFIRSGRLLYSRSFKAEPQDAQSSSLVFQAEQIGLTLGAYSKENLGPPVDRYVVISSDDVSGLSNKLQENYGCPIEVMNPYQDISVNKGISLESLYQESGASFVPCLGFALMPDSAKINLIPQEVITSKRTKVQRRVAIHFFLWVTFLYILGAACVGAEGFWMMAKLKSLKSQARKLEQAGTSARLTIDTMGLLNEQLQNKVFFADVIKELYLQAPEGVTFRSLDLKDMDSLTLQGYSTVGTSVYAFQQKLIQSELFTDVNLHYSTKKKKYQKEYTDFKMTCRLSSPIEDQKR